MAETTVFQSGNSQAVRLPKEFRFKSKTVEIFRRGDEVVLREKATTVKELLDSLPPLTDEEAAQFDKMLAMIKAPLPPDTRQYAWWEQPAEPKARRPAKKSSRPR